MNRIDLWGVRSLIDTGARHLPNAPYPTNGGSDMATRRLDRADRLIAYFVNKCEEAPGRTRLVKLLYLTDYHARRALGRPISELEYIWYHYGPWDVSFPHRLQHLSELGLITQEVIPFDSGKVGYKYHAGSTGSIAFDFSEAEEAVLTFVCREYSTGPLRDLLEDIVYQTEPMQIAKERGARNEPLAMDIVNNDQADALGIDFEELVRRSSAARAGKTFSTEELIASL